MAVQALNESTASSELDLELAQARDLYSSRRPRSKVAHDEAAGVMPGGNTRTVLYHGPYPLRIVRGGGARISDVDGHTYLNLLGEYSAGIFGHSHPVIREALAEALENGINLGGHNLYESRLAQLVCDRFPSIELVRFTNSGTEANLMAVSTARAVTGRSKVMVFRGGYHGGLLYFSGNGSPINVPFPYVIGRYNDIDATEALIREHASELACVLVEPMMGSSGCIPASREFLSMLRTATLRSGALLILDEVMTSRLAPGGMQDLLGIQPDLTTLGKYIGGGMSFGAFGGRRDLMEIYNPSRPNAVPHAGTFNNNVMTMAAGVAGLSRVLTRSAMDDLNRRGDRLRDRLNALFVGDGARFQATGFGSLLAIHPTQAPIRSPEDLQSADDRLRELLFLDLLEEGFYIARRGFMALSLPITDADIEGLIDTLGGVLQRRAAFHT